MKAILVTEDVVVLNEIGAATTMRGVVLDSPDSGLDHRRYLGTTEAEVRTSLLRMNRDRTKAGLPTITVI